MSDQDRNKHLSEVLAAAPRPDQFRVTSSFRAAQVRWLLDLADLIDALGLADTDDLAAAARTAAFGLLREVVESSAQAARAAAVATA